MKKAVGLLLCALLLMAALFGCSKKEDGPLGAKPQDPEAQGAAVYRIGLVQCGSFAPLDVMRESFMSRLDEWGYDESKVELDYQNAGENEKKAEEICKQFTRDKVDMIVAVGAPAAKAASSAVGSSGVKVLFAGVNNPAPMLDIQNPNAPERGITGVSDRVSGQRSVELVQKIKPDVHSIGLLCDAEDENAAEAVKAIEAYCRQAGLATQSATAVSADGAADSARELLSQCDVLFTPGDGVVSEAAGKLAELSKEVKKPWLAGSDALVQKGALAALSPDYELVGSKTADMAVKVIVGGQVSQMPVHFFDSWAAWVNQTAMEGLSADLPEDFLSTANFAP